MLAALTHVLEPWAELWERAGVSAVRVAGVCQDPGTGWAATRDTVLGHVLPPKGPPVAHICQKVLNTTFPLNMLPHHPLSAMRLNFCATAEDVA